MRRERDNQDIDLSGRIRSLEQFTGALVAHRPGERPDEDHLLAEVIGIHEATPHGPEPRRSRVFLRGRDGHGVFADLTVTAPVPRPATD